MKNPNNPDNESPVSRSRRSLRRRAAAMSRHEAETLQVQAFVDAGHSGLAALVLIFRALLLAAAIVTAGWLLGNSPLPARVASAIIGLL